MMRCRLLILIAVLAIPLSLIAGPAVQAASAQGVSTAVVTPASGLAGSTVTGSGSNWTAGDHIQAYWSDTNSTLGGEVVVAPGGTFVDPGLTIPTGVASGSHQILFSDVEGRYFEVADFDVTGTSPTPPPSSCSAPSVSLTPSAGPVGSQFLMKGAGWISGGVVHITLPNGSKGIFYLQQVTPTVSSGGSWQTTVTVGKSPAGSYTFTFAETGCTSQTGTFQVTASPAPPPACPSNPTVAFSPSSGHLGTTFTITGSGWVPGGKVTGTLPYGSPGLFYGYQTPTVNASGGFSYKETVGTGPSGPTPPGSYTFTYAEKYGGCSPSFQQTFTVTPKPPAGHVPAAPSNLTVTAVDQNDIRLNWQDNSNDETRFEINNGVISKYVGANSRSYKWGGLAPGTHMCFMIRAHNSAGDSAWDPNVSPSNVCTTTPKPSGQPDWADSSFCSRSWPKAPNGARYTGITYKGVAACGNAENASNTSNLQGTISYQPPGGATVYFDSAGFQCVELAARYFYFHTTLIPDNPNTPPTGTAFVSTEHQNYPQIAINGVGTDTFQNSITPGNIISMSSSSDPTGEGHVGVVMGFQYTKGKLTGIKVMDENGDGTGTGLITVSNKGIMSFDSMYNMFQWTMNLPGSG